MYQNELKRQQLSYDLLGQRLSNTNVRANVLRQFLYYSLKENHRGKYSEVITDLNGVIMYACKNMPMVLGYHPAELIGVHTTDITAEEHKFNNHSFFNGDNKPGMVLGHKLTKTNHIAETVVFYDYTVDQKQNKNGYYAVISVVKSYPNNSFGEN